MEYFGILNSVEWMHDESTKENNQFRVKENKKEI